VKPRTIKPSSLKDEAEKLVFFGKECGADEVEATIINGSEFSVDILFGEIENLLEAGSRYAGVKIIKENKTAYLTSSDMSERTLQILIKNAITRAKMGSPDEFSGLPALSGNEIDPSSLRLYDPEIARLSSEKKIALAKETESIALQDKRITNSHGANFETKEIKTVMANSNGFSSEYDETFCSLSLGLQAGGTDSKVEDYWFSSKRHFKDLDKPEYVAHKAVERTVRQLHPKKIKTQNVPVVFEPMMTSWLIAFLFSCISGISVYQKSSFLADKLGEKIGGSNFTVIDDGLLPERLGTRPFDSEGVPSQKTPVIENGVLKHYLCNTYAARKLGLRSTGNADGNGIGPNNFYLQQGETQPDDIISSLDKGLILIRTIGHGLNPVTGDISRGAFGLWIEKGEIQFPVSEVTISGNLGNILNTIEMVGSDLEFRSSISGPTIKIQELTVAGE
jgi:PmbA protein